MDEQKQNYINPASNNGYSGPMGVSPIKKKFPLWAKIAIAVVGLIIIGGGVALASRIWDPLWSPFRPSPEKVLGMSFEKMEKVSSFHSEVSISVDIKGSEQASFVISLKDDTKILNSKESESKGEVNFSGGMEGISVSATGEYIVLGETAYFKLTKIPSIPVLPVDLSVVKNRWIKMEQGQKSEDFIDLMSSLESKDMIVVKKELPDQTVGGRKAYHYVAGINKQGVKEVFENVFSSLAAVPTGNLANLDYIAEKVSEINVEYWIGKKDSLVYRIKIDTELIDEYGTGNKLAMNAALNFSDYNKTFEVKAPVSYTTFEELSALLVGGFQ